MKGRTAAMRSQRSAYAYREYQAVMAQIEKIRKLADVAEAAGRFSKQVRPNQRVNAVAEQATCRSLRTRPTEYGANGWSNRFLERNYLDPIFRQKS